MRHYLKAVAAVGIAKDGRAVVAKMKEIPVDDPLFGKGQVRADGSVTHSDVSVPGEGAVRVEGRVGLLQARRHADAGAGLRPAGSRLPARQVIGSPTAAAPRRERGSGLPSIAESTRMEISASALTGQLLIGLINGSALAMLSLGLAIIFGLLNIINVTHGAQYMMGAFCAWMLLDSSRHRLLAGTDHRAGHRRR